jgi:hypothetical protein
MSKPNEGFDLDNYDFTEYASALDGENLSSTDCDMESESIWTPARRHHEIIHIYTLVEFTFLCLDIWGTFLIVLCTTSLYETWFKGEAEAFLFFMA